MLKDGGHNIVHCSNCNKELCDIWITRPEASFTWKVVCKCPFCGDKSFENVVNGLFHVGGIGKDIDLETGHDIPITRLSDVKFEDDRVTILVEKAIVKWEE